VEREPAERPCGTARPPIAGRSEGVDPIAVDRDERELGSDEEGRREDEGADGDEPERGVQRRSSLRVRAMAGIPRLGSSELELRHFGDAGRSSCVRHVRATDEPAMLPRAVTPVTSCARVAMTARSTCEHRRN
jgi:hypothetical protein